MVVCPHNLVDISDDTQLVLAYSASVCDTCRDCARVMRISSNTVSICVLNLCCVSLHKTCRAACLPDTVAFAGLHSHTWQDWRGVKIRHTDV